MNYLFSVAPYDGLNQFVIFTDYIEVVPFFRQHFCFLKCIPTNA